MQPPASFHSEEFGHSPLTSSWRTQPRLWGARAETGDAESGGSLKEKALTPLIAWETYPAACRPSGGSRICQGENICARTSGVSWVCNKIQDCVPASTKRQVLAVKVQPSLAALTTVTCTVSCDEHQQEFVLGDRSLLQSQLYDIHVRREPGFPAMPRPVLLPTHLPFPPELGFGSKSGLTLQPLGTAALAKAAKMEQPCPCQERHAFGATEGRQDNDPAKPFLKPREGSEIQDWLMRLCTTCWACRLQATGLGASDTNRSAPALPSAFCILLPSSFVALSLLPQKAT